MTIPPDTMPRVPISWGELLDKITILEIKVERLTTQSARANAAKELDLLREIAGPIPPDGETMALVARLKALNERLWENEDNIRDHEAVRSSLISALSSWHGRSISTMTSARWSSVTLIWCWVLG